MASPDKWLSVGGPDLLGSDAEQLPAAPAVYMWRRKAAPPPGVLESRSTFVKWLEKEVATPYCVVPNRELTPYLHLERLVVGGHQLSSSKRAVLDKLCDDRAFRRTLLRVVHQAMDHGPALYVGRAEDLQVRVRRHLAVQSDLSARLELAGLSWKRVSLTYFLLPGALPSADVTDAETLETIEAVVTSLSLGSLVMRVG
jgi:hypothetical protein